MTYWLGFLGALHGFLLIYVNAPFLATFTSEKWVGVIYTIASIIAVIAFVFTSKILDRFGNYHVTLFVVAAEFIAILALAFAPSFVLAVLAFILYNILIRIVALNVDVFLESGSDDAHTGNIRGIFLTVTNIALVLSPFSVGLILGDTSDYWKVYLVSAIVLIPTFFFLLKAFKNFKDPEYTHIPFFKTLKTIWKRKNIYYGLMSNIMLRIFYATMVIYTPLYLHNHLEIPWKTLGIIFTVMLIPFATLELPLGKLADTRFGEKEILTLGFIWIGITTIILSFITTTSVVVWAIALLLTRIGASTIEIMTETYFFRQVDGTDSDIMSFFRMVQPIPYIIVPLVGSLLLFVIDIRYIFLVLGIAMFWGLRYSLALKDTK